MYFLDSLYQSTKNNSHLKSGAQYKDNNFIKEANRLVKLFRNKGVYHFNENYISFAIDTLKNYQTSKVDINILFNNRGTKYRDLKLKELNLDDDGKIEWLCKENMLLKRPVVEYNDKVMVSFNEDTYKEELLK